MGVIICLGGLLLQRLPLGWPRAAGFLCVTGMVLLGNLFWWAWVDELLAETQNSSVSHGNSWRALRFVWAIFMCVMVLPVCVMMLRLRWWDRWPSLAILWI